MKPDYDYAYRGHIHAVYYNGDNLDDVKKFLKAYKVDYDMTIGQGGYPINITVTGDRSMLLIGDYVLLDPKEWLVIENNDLYAYSSKEFNDRYVKIKKVKFC